MANKAAVRQKPMIDKYSAEVGISKPKSSKTSGAVLGPGSVNSQEYLKYDRIPGGMMGAAVAYGKQQLASGGYAASPTLQQSVQEKLMQAQLPQPPARQMQPVNLGKYAGTVPGPMQVQQVAPGPRPAPPQMPQPMGRGMPPSSENQPGMYQPPVPQSAMQNPNWQDSQQYQANQARIDRPNNTPMGPGMMPQPVNLGNYARPGAIPGQGITQFDRPGGPFPRPPAGEQPPLRPFGNDAIQPGQRFPRPVNLSNFAGPQGSALPRAPGQSDEAYRLSNNAINDTPRRPTPTATTPQPRPLNPPKPSAPAPKQNKY